MSDHFFLPKHEQDQLCAILDTIPPLVEDLAVTISRQDRLGDGPRISRGKQASPLPYNVGASDAADALHNELARWVKLVCEQRQLDYHEGRDDTISLARWLHRWHIALAMTEGAQDALPNISGAVKAARRSTDRPTERTPERPEEETLENVGLTKAELQEAIHCRTGRRVTRKDINNWIQRRHITDIGGGYFSLAEALAYMQKDMRVA